MERRKQRDCQKGPEETATHCRRGPVCGHREFAGLEAVQVDRMKQRESLPERAAASNETE